MAIRRVLAFGFVLEPFQRPLGAFRAAAAHRVDRRRDRCRVLPARAVAALLVSLGLVLFILATWVMMRAHDRALCEHCVRDCR